MDILEIKNIRFKKKYIIPRLVSILFLGGFLQNEVLL